MIKSTKIKKIVPLLILAFLLIFCGCERYGKIGDVEKRSEKEVTEKEEEQKLYTPSKTSLKYEWAYLREGRINLKLPYPASWTVKKNTDYKAAFIAPADDPYFPGCTIYFHSSLDTDMYAEDSSQILPRFLVELSEDRYTCGGKMFLVDGTSEIDDFIVNKKISDPDKQLQLTYRDYNAKAWLSGNSSTSKPLYRELCCFYWDKAYPCVLSGLVPQEKADLLSELLSYMFSNGILIKQSAVKYESINVFPSATNLTVPIPSIYKEYEASGKGGFCDVRAFLCPAGSGSAWSHTYVCFYETKREDFDMSPDNFETKYLNVFLKNSIGMTNSSYDYYGYLAYDSGKINFKKAKKSAKEYIYLLDLAEGDYAEGFFPQQAWEIIALVIENGKYVDVICIAAPSGAVNAVYESVVTKMAYGLYYDE